MKIDFDNFTVQFNSEGTKTLEDLFRKTTNKFHKLACNALKHSKKDKSLSKSDLQSFAKQSSTLAKIIDTIDKLTFLANESKEYDFRSEPIYTKRFGRFKNDLNSISDILKKEDMAIYDIGDDIFEKFKINLSPAQPKEEAQCIEQPKVEVPENTLKEIEKDVEPKVSQGRIAYRKQIPMILQSLLFYKGDFENHAFDIITDSCHALIGLSQIENIDAVLGETVFSGLETHLGVEAYQYVDRNFYPETRILWKASLLYLLIGFESSVTAIREHTIEMFEKIVFDYIKHAHCECSNEYLHILLALSCGYCTSQKNSLEARQKLVKIWEDQPNILPLLKMEPYYLNVNIENSANASVNGQEKETNEFTLKRKRVYYFKNLLKISNKLLNLQGNFDAHAIEIITLSTKALIGLSQRTNQNLRLTSTFKGLEAYLNCKEYAYIRENKYNTTYKVEKAAVLYCIKGLESKDPLVKQNALQAFNIITDDYIKANITAHGYPLSVICPLCKAFYDNATDKNEAAQKLKKLWKDHPGIIDQLKKSPFNIDLFA